MQLAAVSNVRCKIKFCHIRRFSRK